MHKINATIRFSVLDSYHYREYLSHKFSHKNTCIDGFDFNVRFNGYSCLFLEKNHLFSRSLYRQIYERKLR